MSQVGLSPCSKAITEEPESSTANSPIAEQRCMYKVHDQLRKVNEEAYKPVLLAIGPYHGQGTIGQGFMEEQKLCYLEQMLKRTEGSEDRYMKALQGLAGKARKCYVECTSQIDQDKFAKKMLLDGCFIIELFRKYEIYTNRRVSTNLQENERLKEYILKDPIFKMEWVLPRIARDLLLFENQLPFFVLVELFRMSESNGSRNSGELVVDIVEEDEINVECSTSTDLSICKLSDLALRFFKEILPFQWNDNGNVSNCNSKENIKSLVCLMHETPIPELPELVWKRLLVGFRFKNVEFEHLLGLIHTAFSISILDTEINPAKERHEEEKVKLKKDEIFKPLFGLISKAVNSLLAKRKDMSNQEPLQREGLKGDSEENMEAETDQRWERELIPYWSELKEAGITFEMAKKFKDHVKNIQAEETESEENELETESEENEFENIHGATELEEAGIEFKKSKNYKWFSIKFNNGLMELSPLIIEDQTETCLRNLIAYEQYCDRHESLNYVTNYVRFMDNLINSPKDVELLRQRGIIQNYLGDDVATSTMVNKLCDNITFSFYNIYSRTSRNVNKHCRRRRNKWMAKLRREYFNSPWALISFLGAVLLLALTLVQTIFSIIR